MQEHWYQIEIKSDAALSGPSLAQLIRTIARGAPVITAVGVTDIEGAGDDLESRFPRDRVTILDLDTFLVSVTDIDQFDWGDFFLARVSSDLLGVQPSASYEEILPRVLATVRAVDDTYFYVYTRDRAIAQRLHNAHRDSRLKEGNLAELDFPF